jgi:hypothetical protein
MAMPQTTATQIDSPASALTITALAAQLRDSPTAGVLQMALCKAMLNIEPTTPDENLTLIRLVWENIDDDDPLAGALESVCRAMERDGARNLRFHREEPVHENDSETE